jgi:sugar lactone lactonase YvrE
MKGSLRLLAVAIGLSALLVGNSASAQLGGLPTVTQQPNSQNIVPGQDVTLTATVSLGSSAYLIDGYPRLSVSVLKNGVFVTSDLTGVSATLRYDPNTGQVTATYTIKNFQAANAGEYTLLFRVNGYILVADGGNDAIRVITHEGSIVSPIFAAAPLRAPPPGQVTSAFSAGPSGQFSSGTAGVSFSDPRGIALDSAGNIYVADRGNCVIRKIAPGGLVSTFAGAVGVLGHTDGPGSVARFVYPYGLAVDAADNLYVSDTGNNQIRKISPAGDVTTLAGSYTTSGSADGTGPAARFFAPYGLAVDATGNVFVADSLNNSIRRITPDGVVTTFAGSTTGVWGSTDDTGTLARFNYPCGVAFDATGNLLVTDGQNYTIRKITPAGVVTTFAGSPGSAGSADGTGSAARFYYPWGVTIDTNGTGNIYVSDAGNDTIRMITPAGVVTTLVGSAGNPGNVDGAGSTGRLFYPYEIKYGFYTLVSNPAALSVDTSGGTPYAIWRQAKFTAGELTNPSLSGPNAIYGLDGLSNLVKYALGLEPKTDVFTALPAVTKTATDWVYTYTRPASATDVTYAVEVSTDLITWTTTGVTHEFVSTSGGIDTWRARYPLASAPNAFFRLSVTR